MIKKVSELLQKLIIAENEALKKQNIKHAPTIGDMYEGLTQNVLDKALPVNSPLDVTSGFIVDNDGNMSGELDCLIVSSEGQKIPYTTKRKYATDDVVAVIQVKKNLYSADIKDGYENLLSVMKFKPARLRSAILFRDAFQSITRRPLPERYEVNSLPFEIQMLYHALFVEMVAPVRIILGYNGFKSHAGFRQSFVNYLSDQSDSQQPKKGYGPTSFPSLIVCGQYSLVKCNGMPFIGPIEQDNFWPFYCSTSSNPIELMLQVIWTKLVYDSKLEPSVFEDDVWRQSVARFLSAKCVQHHNGQQGWEFRVTNVTDEYLKDSENLKLWEPVFLDHSQFVIMNRLCAEGQLSLLEPDLDSFISNHGYSLESFVESLNTVGLAARYGNDLVLLTQNCVCVILPDGRFAAGENAAGQLTRWMNIYLADRNAQKLPPPLFY
ncbi:MAG: hypothetical protein HGB06_04590 [Chlorobaculum sp.]|jgi:hypothetical protein|nr:hypothetical protein [Chlorobaculum sp.]